jgi:hypothetical protein
LIVDGSYNPGQIESFDRTVDDIVREPAHGYVAAIGGDIHNYQRYPVEVRDRCIEYIVAGGGGAFMHATHRIDRVDLGGVEESRFRAFPLRSDSLWLYSRVLLPALRRLVFLAASLFALFFVLFAVATTLLVTEGASVSTWILTELLVGPPLFAGGVLLRQVHASGAMDALRVPADALTRAQARAWMAARLGGEPVLGPAPDLSPDAGAVAEFVAPRFRRTGGFLQSFFSEIFDIDRPPLYKQFLVLDADRDRLRITCFAAIGVDQEAERPYVEEWVEIPLEPARAEIRASSIPS